MRFSLFLAIALVITFTPVSWSETVKGKAYSKEELGKAINEWEFQVANTGGRHTKVSTRSVRNRYESYSSTREIDKGSYGCFIFCVNADNRKEILFTYTYGEPDKSTAMKKAFYGFKMHGKQCYASPVFYHKSSKDR